MEQGEAQHQGGDIDHANPPHGAHPEGRHHVEVGGEFVDAAQHPVQDHDQDEGDGHDANVIGELVHDVEVDDAAGIGEERQR